MSFCCDVVFLLAKQVALALYTGLRLDGRLISLDPGLGGLTFGHKAMDYILILNTLLSEDVEV